MLSFKKQSDRNNMCGTKILGTQLFSTTQMRQGSTCHVVAQHGDISKLKKTFVRTWEVCATIAIRCHQDIHVWISQCYKPTETTFVAQRFLGHNCLGLRRCVRGQRVMLLHSMEISASFRKLVCWLGKSVQPLPSDAIKTSMFGFLNAKFQTTKNKPTERTLWHKDSWDTTV